MKKFLLLALICFGVSVNAEKRSVFGSHIFTIKSQMQEAVNEADVEKFKYVSTQLERLATFGEKEWLVNYYLSLAHYRISVIISDKELAEKYIESAKEAVQISIKEKDDFADSHALLASILGIEIGFKPNLGMTNGMKSAQELEKAKKLSPSNPRIYMIEGTSKLYTPKMFGGSVDKALALFEKSAELFEKEESKGIYPDWGKDEVYVWIGNAYREKKEDSKAEEFYRKALEINPECGWAKHLLGEFEQETEKEE